MPSSILADFGPDIHVFRVKNISYFSIPRGIAGSVSFPEVRNRKETESESGLFPDSASSRLRAAGVQDHDAVDQAAGEHLQLFVSVHLEFHTLLHCSITT